MIRQISAEGIAYLVEREGGYRLDVHDDGFGYPTVGVGHLVADEDELKLGDTITREEADAFLQDDLFEAREAVERYCGTWATTQYQFDALVIFTFNVGVGALRTSTLRKQADRAASVIEVNEIVQQQMPRWNKVNREFVRGLKNRRVDTAQMFVEADYTVDWSGLEGQV